MHVLQVPQANLYSFPDLSLLRYLSTGCSRPRGCHPASYQPHTTSVVCHIEDIELPYYLPYKHGTYIFFNPPRTRAYRGDRDNTGDRVYIFSTMKKSRKLHTGNTLKLEFNSDFMIREQREEKE